MKATAILRTQTNNNEIFNKRIPVKLDINRSFLVAKIDGGKLAYVIPRNLNPEKPLIYAITERYPLDADIHTSTESKEQKHLIVTIH